MSSVEPRSKQAPPEDEGGKIPQRASRDPGTAKSRVQFAPVLITLATLVLAGLLAWAGWLAYMAAPWTRDGTVRVYVVTMAPEVAGRIVELPVADNQFVHKGDALFEIDPADYRIALDQARAQRSATPPRLATRARTKPDKAISHGRAGPRQTSSSEPRAR